jgi:hypothetical protein
MEKIARIIIDTEQMSTIYIRIKYSSFFISFALLSILPTKLCFHTSVQDRIKTFFKTTAVPGTFLFLL